MRMIWLLSREVLLGYLYSVLHSPALSCEIWRLSPARFFPRPEPTSRRELFDELARLGFELVSLHLVKARPQQALSAYYDQIARAWQYKVGGGQELTTVALKVYGSREARRGQDRSVRTTRFGSTLASRREPAKPKSLARLGSTA